MKNADQIYKAGFDAGVAFAKLGLDRVRIVKESVEKNISKSKEYYRKRKARLYAREYYRKIKEKITGVPVKPRVKD